MIWKQLASNNLSNGILDKRKSILSKGRALDRNSDDGAEDEFKNTIISRKNQYPLEKGYQSDYLFPSFQQSFSKTPLQSPFKGNIFRKRKESIKGNAFIGNLIRKS